MKAGQVITVTAKSLVVLRAFTSPAVEPDHSVAASLASFAGANTPNAATTATEGRLSIGDSAHVGGRHVALADLDQPTGADLDRQHVLDLVAGRPRPAR